MKDRQDLYREQSSLTKKSYEQPTPRCAHMHKKHLSMFTE